MRWPRRQVWEGLIILVAVALATSWVVKKYRQPGTMTVLESLAMDMSAMTAPVGRVPVATEKAKRGPIEAVITYTGSVLPFTEEEVYPRVTGRILEMPYYPGDRLQAGQVVAKLDTSELGSRVAEASFEATAAEQEVRAAQAELAQARAKVKQAQQEQAAAQARQSQAEAQVEAAESDLADAESGLDSAWADLEYWKAEIKREEALLKQGAVSQQEYDSEKAQYASAQAKVKQAEALIKQKQASVRSAQAMITQTRSEVEAASAAVEAEQAGANAVQRGVDRAAAMTAKARAAARTAGIVKGYANVVTTRGGVVTARLISPGTLVQPGMPIVKVADLSRVRLQANVAEKDLGSVKVGDQVRVRSPEDRKLLIEARLTSVFPAADPTTRTALVEAVVANPGQRISPGRYVRMEIVAARHEDALSVPNSSLVTVSEAGKPVVWIVARATAGKVQYTCVMHPGVISDHPGNCPKCGMELVPKQLPGKGKAHRVEVGTGITDGERTEIVSGLHEGDEVIYAGWENLQEGQAVAPTAWGAEGPTELPPVTGEMKMPGMEGGGEEPGGNRMESMPGMGGH